MRSSVKLYLFSLILAFTMPFRAFAQNMTSLIINELMINPNNVASLPPFEYIELYNNSTEVIDLKNIAIHINNNQQTLPTYKIAPKQYVILCPEAAATQFLRYGNALILPRWYALNNASATVKLTQNDVTIDAVSYRDSWYNSSSKKNGGWSLERINPNLSCGIHLNWAATQALTRGTPGKNNTILDFHFTPQPTIKSYKIAQNKVSIEFTLAHEFLPAINNATFHIDQGIGTASHIAQQDGWLQLSFSKNLDPQKLYTLHITDLKICNLNLPPFETKLFEQKDIYAGDIIINEVLFNPKEAGVDFVELFNCTENPINLQNFKLGNSIITNQFYLLASKSFLAVTTNKTNIQQYYPNAVAENILETSSLPPYTNQQGNVTLYSDQNILLDSIYYSAKMHSAHLIDPKGVSLERITVDKPVFHSASTVHGGATPGYLNSVSTNNIPQNIITLTSKTFSPNGDGYEDELEINYELISPNYIIAVEIYNEKGQLIRKLAHQNLAGTHGKLIWDGKNDTGGLCPRGHYISFTKIFNHEGKTQNFKQPFVLINSLTRY